MNMPEVIKNPSQVIDDVFDLIFCFVKSFFKICSGTEVTFNATLQDAGSERRLFVDFLNSVIKLRII